VGRSLGLTGLEGAPSGSHLLGEVEVSLTVRNARTGLAHEAAWAPSNKMTPGC